MAQRQPVEDAVRQWIEVGRALSRQIGQKKQTLGAGLDCWLRYLPLVIAFVSTTKVSG